MPHYQPIFFIAPTRLTISWKLCLNLARYLFLASLFLFNPGRSWNLCRCMSRLIPFRFCKLLSRRNAMPTSRPRDSSTLTVLPNKGSNLNGACSNFRGTWMRLPWPSYIDDLFPTLDGRSLKEPRIAKRLLPADCSDGGDVLCLGVVFPWPTLLSNSLVTSNVFLGLPAGPLSVLLAMSCLGDELNNRCVMSREPSVVVFWRLSDDRLELLKLLAKREPLRTHSAHL